MGSAYRGGQNTKTMCYTILVTCSHSRVCMYVIAQAPLRDTADEKPLHAPARGLRALTLHSTACTWTCAVSDMSRAPPPWALVLHAAALLLLATRAAPTVTAVSATRAHTSDRHLSSSARNAESSSANQPPDASAALRVPASFEATVNATLTLVDGSTLTYSYAVWVDAEHGWYRAGRYAHVKPAMPPSLISRVDTNETWLFDGAGVGSRLRSHHNEHQCTVYSFDGIPFDGSPFDGSLRWLHTLWDRQARRGSTEHGVLPLLQLMGEGTTHRGEAAWVFATPPNVTFPVSPGWYPNEYANVMMWVAKTVPDGGDVEGDRRAQRDAPPSSLLLQLQASGVPCQQSMPTHATLTPMATLVLEYSEFRVTPVSASLFDRPDDCGACLNCAPPGAPV